MLELLIVVLLGNIYLQLDLFLLLIAYNLRIDPLDVDDLINLLGMASIKRYMIFCVWKCFRSNFLYLFNKFYSMALITRFDI